MPGKNPTRQKEASARTWGLKDIEELLDLLAEREIAEFEMKQQGVKIRVRRGNAQAGSANSTEGFLSPSPGFPSPLTSPHASPVASPASPPSGISQVESPPAEHPESLEGLHIQKSPIVGTFYATPSPSAPHFVKLGDEVQVGQVLCIIEAMKLMNELESEVTGEIVRIYVENGQPVEYGQSLFAIKPSHKK